MRIDGRASLGMVVQITLLDWLKTGQTRVLLHSKNELLAQYWESCKTTNTHFFFFKVYLWAKVLQQKPSSLILILCNIQGTYLKTIFSVVVNYHSIIDLMGEKNTTKTEIHSQNNSPTAWPVSCAQTGTHSTLPGPLSLSDSSPPLLIWNSPTGRCQERERKQLWHLRKQLAWNRYHRESDGWPSNQEISSLF